MDITITLTVPDAAASTVINTLLGCAAPAKVAKRPKEEKEEIAASVPRAEGAPAPAPAPAASAVPPSTVTAAQLGSLVTEFMEKVGVPAARQIFQQFGVKKIQDIPTTRYQEFVDALTSAREMSGK